MSDHSAYEMLVRQNRVLRDALKQLTYTMIMQHHGMRFAQAVKDNGWRWPPDGPDSVNITLDKAVRALNASGGEDISEGGQHD